MSNYKTVFFTLGVLLIVLGFSMLVPITVQLIYSEFNSTFLISSIITITFGVLFFLANIDHNKSLSTQQAFLLTALSWIGVAIFGSIPFIFSDLNLSLTDAFFESMSGITTTGATIINNLSDTPKAILSWRAILQKQIPLEPHLLTRFHPLLANLKLTRAWVQLKSQKTMLKDTKLKQGP